jgi:uncharacterized protein
MSVVARLTGLNVYPVKSCRGISLTEAVLTPHGIEHDREWMVTDEAGQFVTQRTFPRLALIETELTAETLRLRAPGRATLEISFSRLPQAERPVQIWQHSTTALDEGDTAAAWFAEFLGARLRLVRWHPEQRRLSNLEWTAGVEAENRFTDGYPYLVLGEESVADLNGRIGGAPLPMNRFRPNLVIAGVAPYAEDSLRTLRTEGIELRIVKPCIRCRITTTDQATAEVGVEPLRTLAGYRRDPRFTAPMFGQNVILIDGAGRRLRVGTEFTAE